MHHSHKHVERQHKRVYVSVLQTRVPYSHQIMQTEARTRNFLNSRMFLLHCREEAPPTMSQYPKSVSHYPTATREPVVKDALFHAHVPMSKRLHHPGPQGKRVVPDEELWYMMVVVQQWFGSRESYMCMSRISCVCHVSHVSPRMSPDSRDTLRAELLKMPLSEDEQLRPMSAHRNLYSESTKPRSIMEKKP